MSPTVRIDGYCVVIEILNWNWNWNLNLNLNLLELAMVAKGGGWLKITEIRSENMINGRGPMDFASRGLLRIDLHESNYIAY